MTKKFKNDIKGYLSNEFILLICSAIIFVILACTRKGDKGICIILILSIFSVILCLSLIYNFLFWIRFTKVPITIQNELIIVHSIIRKYQFYYSEIKLTDYKFTGKMSCNYGTVIFFLKNGKKIRIQRVADLFEVRKYF